MSNALVYHDEAADLFQLMEEHHELVLAGASDSDLAQATDAVAAYLGDLPVAARVDRLCDAIGYADARVRTGEAEEMRVKQWVANAKAVKQRLEARALFSIQDLGLKRVDGQRSSLVLQANPPRVDYTDESMIPDAYQQVTVTMDLGKWNQLVALVTRSDASMAGYLAACPAKTFTRKADITKALKRGDGVPGAFLVQDMRVVRK